MNLVLPPAGRHRAASGPGPAGRAGFVAALLIVPLLVVAASQATFSDTTGNTGNVIGAATVELVDDDAGSVLFNVTTLLPGETTVNCIVVTYQGTAPDPAAVTLYSGGYTDSGNFADYLNLVIEEGSGGTFADCTGFISSASIESGGTLTDFDTVHTGYATGAGTWDPSSTPESTTYRITFVLDAAAPDAEQGESVTGLTFTWEVRSA